MMKTMVVVLLRSGGGDKIRVPRQFLSSGKAPTKLGNVPTIIFWMYVPDTTSVFSKDFAQALGAIDMEVILYWIGSIPGITPMKMAGVKDMLIMRKLGSVEPDNYWYRVCEGEAESVIQRPWHLRCKCRRKTDIVSAITAKTEGPSHIRRCWIIWCF
ncbi:hypothetical protein HanXRQr2_Chr12g0529561 [Helianthus annuus]|uniref:DUF7075 domain-containing protein n=1 Tax=Helianthus annuus TaxID=4232 RepID=A0A251SKJ3_HELAN|nr:hypothetical protein HanXRQr2_Chr12g0529561 [Helianthus annuus]KAJ0861754.1 hypothetical protein HanPSC8_Chr12g0510221 [Helianthus annuus]